MSYNTTMHWVRKTFGGVLAAVLFVSLLGGAEAIGLNHALSQPTHLEQWLGQGNLYPSIERTIANQAQQAIGSASAIGNSSLSSSVISQAVQTALPIAQLRQDVTAVIASNYSWLQGKTATPTFTIDLSSAKLSFAQQIGAYAQTRLASLPACSISQLAQASDFDPLTSACRPPNITLTSAGQQITQELASSPGYLSQPVITAATLSPQGSQPYYKSLSFAPTAYKVANRLPLIFGVLIIVSAGLLLIVLPGWRKGIRRIAAALLNAGLVLIIVSFASNYLIRLAQNQLEPQTVGVSLQASLTEVFRRAVRAITTTDLQIGIGLLASALVLYVVMFVHHRLIKQKPPLEPGPVAQTPVPVPAPTPQPAAPKQPAPKPRRPPRLIQ